jgi:ribA/ribD-fused uncharacterized protein
MADTDDFRVLAFRGVHSFLSNFHIEEDGQTVEHRFQAAKAITAADADWILAASTPGEAKRRGRQVNLRLDWEQVKDDVMLDLLRVKFAPGSKLALQLMSTRGLVLEEGNTWGDTYWGVDLRTGEGENRLGKLLMQVRRELIEWDAVKAQIVDDTTGMWYGP